MRFGWLLAAATLGGVSADTSLRNNNLERTVCAGVYGPPSRQFDPQIIVNFNAGAQKDTQGEVGVVVFAYPDATHIGYVKTLSDGRRVSKFMCDQDLVYDNKCREEDVGKYAIHGKPEHTISTEKVSLGGGVKPEPFVYNVEQKGYYCVATMPTPGNEAMKYNIQVRFQSPTGFLPAEDYPLILFHFVMCVIYALIMIVWTVPLIRNRHHVLKLQNYITALGWLMVVEQFIVAVYYFVANRQGNTAGTRCLMALVALWGSARYAYTFFLLLIVVHGYSVVHPSLGKEMVKFRILSGLLWAFTFVFVILDSYDTAGDMDTSSNLQLWSEIVFFPMLLLTVVHYFLILAGINNTTQYLKTRKQFAKVQMYRHLLFIVAGSAVAVLLLIVGQVVMLMVQSARDFVNGYWQHKWILNDGWPNVVYCIAFVSVMILWRPNADNMRYAMSTQLSQSETAEEFEIGSLNGSDEEEDQNFGLDDEARHAERASSESHRGASVGARQTVRPGDTVFDAEANHELSDLDGGEEFEIDERDRRHTGESDEDPLFEAPTQQLGKKGKNRKNR